MKIFLFNFSLFLIKRLLPHTVIIGLIYPLLGQEILNQLSYIFSRSRLQTQTYQEDKDKLWK